MALGFAALLLGLIPVGLQQRRICGLRKRLGHAHAPLAEKDQQMEALVLYANVVAGIIESATSVNDANPLRQFQVIPGGRAYPLRQTNRTHCGLNPGPRVDGRISTASSRVRNTARFCITSRRSHTVRVSPSVSLDIRSGSTPRERSMASRSNSSSWSRSLAVNRRN